MTFGSPQQLRDCSNNPRCPTTMPLDKTLSTIETTVRRLDTTLFYSIQSLLLPACITGMHIARRRVSLVLMPCSDRSSCPDLMGHIRFFYIVHHSISERGIQQICLAPDTICRHYSTTRLLSIPLSPSRVSRFLSRPKSMDCPEHVHVISVILS